MDVGQECLFFSTIRWVILQQRFKSVTRVEIGRDTKSGVQMIPRILLTDSKLASASRRESETAKDKFMSSGIDRDDASA